MPEFLKKPPFSGTEKGHNLQGKACLQNDSTGLDFALIVSDKYQSLGRITTFSRTL
jgi:hypothetical protein